MGLTCHVDPELRAWNKARRNTRGESCGLLPLGTVVALATLALAATRVRDICARYMCVLHVRCMGVLRLCCVCVASALHVRVETLRSRPRIHWQLHGSFARVCSCVDLWLYIAYAFEVTVAVGAV